MGNAGRDQGKGGKYLILPPDYKGQEPEGYLVSRSATYGNWFIMRGFLVKGDPKPAVASFKQHMRLYPLAQAANPPATTFINASGKAFNTIHAMDFSLSFHALADIGSHADQAHAALAAIQAGHLHGKLVLTVA